MQGLATDSLQMLADVGASGAGFSICAKLPPTYSFGVSGSELKTTMSGLMAFAPPLPAPHIFVASPRRAAIRPLPIGLGLVSPRPSSPRLAPRYFGPLAVAFVFPHGCFRRYARQLKHVGARVCGHRANMMKTQNHKTQ